MMVVHGLCSLLQRNNRPKVTFFSQGAATRSDNVLLVDAKCVESFFLGSHGDSHADLYTAVVFFYRGLTAAGLCCVLVLSSGATPGHEAAYVERRSARRTPLFGMVFQQAYADMGLEVLRSVSSADK